MSIKLLDKALKAKGKGKKSESTPSDKKVEDKKQTKEKQPSKQPKGQPRVRSSPRSSLNYRILLICTNKYLMMNKGAYKKVLDNDLSKLKLEYEEALKEKVKLEKILKI